MRILNACEERKEGSWVGHRMKTKGKLLVIGTATRTYNHTSKELRRNLLFGLIGSVGLIRTSNNQ